MFLQKFNKKTVITTISVLVAVVTIGGIGSFVYEMNETKTLQSNIYSNLLALENSSTNAISSEQAKAMIPILKQIQANANTTGADFETALTKQTELEKSIYGLLTNQQYNQLSSAPTSPLSDQMNGIDDNHRDNGGHVDGRHENDQESHDHFDHGDQVDALDQVLPDMVIKQLTSKITN